MHCEHKRLKEFIESKEPFYEYTTCHVFRYNSDLDLVHDEYTDGFFFIRTSVAYKNPYKGSFHREDGPAYVGDMGLFWYYDDVFYEFQDWLKEVPLSEEEIVKLRLKYAQF